VDLSTVGIIKHKIVIYHRVAFTDITAAITVNLVIL